jgi:hypothetical protein
MHPATTAPTDDLEAMHHPSDRSRLFAALVGLGLLGTAGGLPLNLRLVGELAPEEPRLQIAAALIGATAVQVALAALAFVTLARRVGLDAPVLRRALARRSWWPRLRSSLPLAFGLAAAGYAVVLALDLTVFDEVRQQLELPDVPFAGHLAASLYGGIVEELLLRAGVMTVLAWALARLTRQPFGQAPTWLVWTSICGAALAFGLLHLPATAVLVELTPLVVTRALLLNAALAAAFGWLAWRRGIEAAIASHIVADVLLITTQHAIA